MDTPGLPAKIDPDALTAVLDGRWAELRRAVRAQMAAEDFQDPVDLDVEAHRAQVLDRLRLLASTDRPGLGFDPAYGGGGDVGGSVMSFEMLGFGDLSLMVKAGVQWGLFGGAVQLLGTERHHERYLRQIKDLELLGCFAMTEHGHGSDVQHLRTTATYDPATREFVLDTPDRDATKEYIGNAARDGQFAVVFAQLITGGESRGVHAFLVPIRGESAQGVEIEDCGRKAGLNGVDNGRLSFTQVRVPREALLNRFGDVADDGTYTSPIESDGRRFFTMLGTLIRGRVSVAGSAGSATKRALALAVRYGERRRQFARPGERRSSSSITGPTSGNSCPHWRRRMRCTSRRNSSSASSTTSPRTRRRRNNVNWSHGRPGSRPSRPGMPRPPSRPPARRVAAPGTCRRTCSPG